MRHVQIPGTDLTASCLGMGCASLGSRIPRSRGINALEAAFERSVTWYDVAPSYGAGDAEIILADFLKGKRDKVILCSKVGLAPPRHNGLVRQVYRFGRPVIGAAQGLRQHFRALKGTRNVRIPLTPDLIRSSIERSLSRLRTDRLDIFALHDPDPADLSRHEILMALEGVKASGAARYLAVAGTVDAARQAAAAGEVFSIFQLADDPLLRPLPALAAQLQRPAGFVTHSVLGVGGAMDRFSQRLSGNPDLLGQLVSQGYGSDLRSVSVNLLMRRAFASNSQGVVLASMFSGNHLRDNAALADLPLDEMASGLVETILSEGAIDAAHASAEAHS